MWQTKTMCELLLANNEKLLKLLLKIIIDIIIEEN